MANTKQNTDLNIKFWTLNWKLKSKFEPNFELTNIPRMLNRFCRISISVSSSNRELVASTRNVFFPPSPVVTTTAVFVFAIIQRAFKVSLFIWSPAELWWGIWTVWKLIELDSWRYAVWTKRSKHTLSIFNTKSSAPFLGMVIRKLKLEGPISCYNKQEFFLNIDPQTKWLSTKENVQL